MPYEQPHESILCQIHAVSAESSTLIIFPKPSSQPHDSIILIKILTREHPTIVSIYWWFSFRRRFYSHSHNWLPNGSALASEITCIASLSNHSHLIPIDPDYISRFLFLPYLLHQSHSNPTCPSHPKSPSAEWSWAASLAGALRAMRHGASSPCSGGPCPGGPCPGGPCPGPCRAQAATWQCGVFLGSAGADIWWSSGWVGSAKTGHYLSKTYVNTSKTYSLSLSNAIIIPYYSR